MSFQQTAWEAALAQELLTKYTPANKNLQKFDLVEKMMYEAVLELREHLATAGTAKCGSASKGSNAVDDNGFPLTLKTPSSIILNNVTSLVSYLSAIFAFQTPPFGVTQDPAKLHVTAAVREKLTRDSFSGRWTLHLMKAIFNAAVFNYAPMRQWVDSRTQRIQLRSLDPYNTVVDDTVPYEELGSRGSYAYTVELMSLATLYAELLTFPAESLTTAGNAILSNVLDVYKIPEEVLRTGAAYAQGSGYVDELAAQAFASGLSTNTDWAKFGTDQEFSDKSPKRVKMLYRDGNHFAVTTYYIRALPTWLGIEPTRFGGKYDPTTGSIPCYRAIMLGNYVLAIAPESTELNQFSLSVGAVRMQTSGAVNATYAELLMPHQVASTKLDNARYEAIRRELGRSGVYNADLVDADTLNDKHVRMIKGRDGDNILAPQQAFMHDTVDGNALSVLIGEFGKMEYLAAATVGNTPQMRGQRTPGNKLAGEASMEATYAEAPFRVHAMVFQETLVASLREQLKINLKLALRDLTYVDKLTGLRAQVSMKDYVESALAFEVSDGASPASKLVSPDAVGTLLGNLAQIPALQMLYDMRTLFNMFATSLGVPNIDSVPMPSVAQEQLMQLAQAAQAGGGTAPATNTTSTNGAAAPTGVNNSAASPAARLAAQQAAQQATQANPVPQSAAPTA